MNQTQADNFLVWYEGLKTVPDKDFDMEYFVDGKNPKKLCDKNKCGTVGCAAGYLPVFLEDDWLWYKKDSAIQPILKRNIKIDTASGVFGKNVDYLCIDSIDNDVCYDIAEYFGIDLYEAEYIIQPSRYFPKKIPKKLVLNHMLEVADKYGYDLEL